MHVHSQPADNQHGISVKASSFYSGQLTCAAKIPEAWQDFPLHRRYLFARGRAPATPRSLQYRQREFIARCQQSTANCCWQPPAVPHRRGQQNSAINQGNADAVFQDAATTHRSATAVQRCNSVNQAIPATVTGLLQRHFKSLVIFITSNAGKYRQTIISPASRSANV